MFILTFGLQLSTLLCEFFFWMVGKGGLISLKGSAPCHCQAFWRLLGLRGSCGCCGAPAAALACSSCAPAVGGIASSPAELLSINLGFILLLQIDRLYFIICVIAYMPFPWVMYGHSWSNRAYPTSSLVDKELCCHSWCVCVKTKEA